MFDWYRTGTTDERRTFRACFGGWALDALDIQLFSLVIPTLLGLWHISKADAGLVTSITLVASAIGGWIGGTVSDRIGRVRALQVMIAWFAVATFLSAFAQDYGQLLALKALQGLGFGGEWATGVALMSEAIRPRHRGRALASVQSAWAVGWGGAVLLFTAVYSFLPAELAWRALFAIGLLPALLVIWVRRNVREPDASPARLAATSAAPKTPVFATMLGIFSPANLRVTLIGLLLGTGAHGGYYAVTSWLPTYLKTERGLSTLGTGGYLAVIIVAFFCGCLAAAALLDRIGRRMTLGLFAAACVVVVLAYVFVPFGNTAMLFLGFPLGFFSAGIPASMGALFSELYPSGVRGTGVGFCYNAGRVFSAAFPFLVGHLSERFGLGAAIGIDAAVGYGLVVVAVLMLPETKAEVLARDATTPVRLDGSNVSLRTDEGCVPLEGGAAGIDAHAHVFARWLTPAPRHRYLPDYDATVADYLAHLDAHGFSHGVLVQPSFLGTDNDYLLAALAAAPERLRGIAVVRADTTTDELDRLSARGIVGLRLNLIGVDQRSLVGTRSRLLRRRAVERGYQIEVQCEARRLPDVLPPLLDAGGIVVIDHFGLPDPALGIDDPGWRAMLALAAHESRLRGKLSAPYRLGPAGPALADAAAPLLRDAFGAERLILGTDWPHTRFEDVARGRGFLRDFARWIPDVGERRASSAAAAVLFRFRPAAR